MSRMTVTSRARARKGPDQTRPDQTREKLSSPEGDGRDSNTTVFAETIALYHDVCPSLPRIRQVTSTRRRRIEGAQKSLGPDGLAELFARAEASDFLSGRGGKWRADFDWLLKPEHIPRVLEGNYDNRNGAGAVPANVANALQIVANCEEEARNGQA